MSITPNKYGPLCPFGEITVDAAGTAKSLASNFATGYTADPNAPVTAAEPQQYAVACEDIIINSPPSNNGGLYLVQYNLKGNTGGKGSVDTILLYIPKGSGPVSIKKFLGGSRFNPNLLGIDADQNGDKCWPVGIIGS